MEQTVIEFAKQFIDQQALVLIPVLWILGAIMKRTKQLADWLITYILLGAGVILAMLLLGWTVQAFIQGVLVAGAAVLGHQLVKQAQKK